MTSLRSVLAVIFVLAMGVSAQAQIVPRANVPAGDASPTGGSFSVHFPIAFSDVEMKAEENGSPTAIVYMLTGVNDGGTRFSATENSVRRASAEADGRIHGKHEIAAWRRCFGYAAR